MLKGGDTIVATSPADFLHRLHQGSRFDHEGTDEDYMQRFAIRIQQLEGYHIRTDNASVFLADLLIHDFVTITPS